MEKFVTCSQCNEIELDDCAYSLDCKMWCSSCWDVRKYGPARKLCTQRGYHETDQSVVNLSRKRYARENRAPNSFVVDVTCACSARATFYDVLGKPTEDGTGVYIPRGPRRWFVLEGNATPLNDKVDA